jgi:hypothetical protein
METNATLKAQAMVLMLAGYKQTKIASELNISTRTLRRWAREPEFAGELQEERDGLLAIARTQALARAQIDLEEGIASTRFIAAVRENERAAIEVRMRAAGMLMNHSFKTTTFFVKYEDKRDTQKAGARMETEKAETETAGARGEGSGVRPQTEKAESGMQKTETAGAGTAEGKIRNDEIPAESGQNRTSAPSCTTHGGKPQSEIEEAKLLRSRAMTAAEAKIKLIDDFEKKAVQQAKENKTDPATIAEMRDGFERAREALDGTMDAIEVASLAELREVCNDPKNPFFDLNFAPANLK